MSLGAWSLVTQTCVEPRAAQPCGGTWPSRHSGAAGSNATQSCASPESTADERRRGLVGGASLTRPAVSWTAVFRNKRLTTEGKTSPAIESHRRKRQIPGAAHGRAFGVRLSAVRCRSGVGVADETGLRPVITTEPPTLASLVLDWLANADKSNLPPHQGILYSENGRRQAGVAGTGTTSFQCREERRGWPIEAPLVERFAKWQK